MRIVTIGKGNVGGGLARLWRSAGHEVTELGRDGGSAAAADVVVVAVPSAQIADALAKVSGVEGKVTIDATNSIGARNDAFESLAHEIKSIVGGPVAKSFSANFASVYDEIPNQRVKPSNLYAAEDGAREATEQLIRDAGYEPVLLGGLDTARMLEDHLALLFSIRQAGLGPFFYRIAKPGVLSDRCGGPLRRPPTRPPASSRARRAAPAPGSRPARRPTRPPSPRTPTATRS